MVLNYIHYPLGEEITAIGGHYVVSRELRIPVAEREILVTVGYGVMDTTCCGTGGCAYATVHGYVLDWKGSRNEEGLAVTIIDPIRDEELRLQLKKKLLNEETIQQVNFL